MVVAFWPDGPVTGVAPASGIVTGTKIELLEATSDPPFVNSTTAMMPPIASTMIRLMMPIMRAGLLRCLVGATMADAR